MCDERGSEPGLAGAPCFALSVLVRGRYPDAPLMLVQHIENLMVRVLDQDRGLNTLWFHDPIAAVTLLWEQTVPR